MGPQGKRALGENRVQVVLFSSPHTCASHYSTVKNITSGSTKSRLFSSGLSSHSCSLVHVFPKGLWDLSSVQLRSRCSSGLAQWRDQLSKKKSTNGPTHEISWYLRGLYPKSSLIHILSFFFVCYEFIPFLLVQCNIVYSENPCAWLSVHPMFFTHCYSATHSPGSKHAEAPTGHFISIQGTGLNSFTL